MSSNFGLFIFMKEDCSWMYRRTVPEVMGINSEFQLGFYDMLKFVDTLLTKEVPVKSQSLQAKDLVDEGKIEKKRPSHAKIKSLKTLKALSMIE
ncbi:hypothetical protein M9H77_21651 [Catharanthus roseus]|uniref:Uncharacterized protein n=1 Tax=Catharanthus roseus TaxID=4058 RepID=A0ACC0AQV2_CATRO|nr:hypothetical protein M9H77_21651 [Catharanthus roseus]